MAKIDTSKWKEFAVGELFSTFVKPPVLHARQVQEDESGIPYVVRTKYNNGIKCRVARVAGITPSPAEVISWGAENATFFYQEEEFFSGRDIYYIDTREINKGACQFLAVCLQTIVHKYPYNFGLFPDLLKQEIIKLPVSDDGMPDWDYMDVYMRELMDTVESNFDSLQQAESYSSPLDTSAWKRFNLPELFDMRNTKSITQKDIVPDSGNTPYVTASGENNGVLTYVSCPEDWVDEGNCILIGGKTLVFSYQERDFCSNDSHNIALYLKDKEKASELRYLFLISALKASMYQRYSWSDSISGTRIKDEFFYLPVDADGLPDWDYMESYMSNVFEIVEAGLDCLKSLAGQ